MNTQLTIKSGIMYLYGGILEQGKLLIILISLNWMLLGDRSYTLNDLWSIDIKKLNQWNRINKTDKCDWEGSDKEGTRLY